MRATPYHMAAAASLATMLATLTLLPLVDGPAWVVAVIIVVAVLTASGTAARLVIPWWPVVVGVQALAGLFAVTALFAGDVAVLRILPGPASWERFADLFRSGLQLTRDETPPVPSGRGLLLMITVGVAVVALLVDVLAVSLGKPAVAGLPLLAVYCVPAAVLPAGIDWWWFTLGALGFLLLVGADAGDRVVQWGRVLGPAGDPAGERALGGPLAGGRRLAAGCVLAAVLIPAAVPGLDERLLGDRDDETGSGPGGNITVINPILRIHESLVQSKDTIVVTYTTNATSPEPLRIVSDDVFDGKQWSPSVGQIPRGNQVQNGLPTAPGLTPQVPRTALQSEFRTFDLRQTYLPLPYPTTKVKIDGPWLYDTRALNVVGNRVTTANLQYTAQHLAVAPTVEQLQNAPAPPSAVLETYGKLPASTPAEIRATARRAAGDGNAYEQAMALQQWFRGGGGFTYDLNVRPPRGKDASSQDALVTFLRDKRGYCVQFASAMAVMARTLGIPSRVGVGFLPGDQQADGSWAISIRDAHAWPELYFANVGWVRFEPTPGVRSGTAPEWAIPPSEIQEPAPPSPSASASASRQVPQTLPQETQQTPEPAPDQTTSSLWRRMLEAVPWRVAVAVLLLAALAFVPLTVTHAGRRTRWRRASGAPPPQRVEAAWDELRERLEDLGVRWAVSWTPRALQQRLADDHTLGGTERVALGRLVTDIEQERYAPPGTPVRQIPELRADVDTVVAGVAASTAVSEWARRRARWLPVSGWQTVTGAMRRVDVVAGEAGRRVGEGVGPSVRRLIGRR
jgi:transglutaminase-like putative cysteine protease